MSKGNGKKPKKPEGRKITQVYISEDGREEVSETIALREESEPESDIEPKHHSSSKTIRTVAVLTAMFFSMLMAMAVGVGLALYDSNRTIAELNAIILGRDVMAATEAPPAKDTKPVPENTADKSTKPAAGQEDTVKSEEVKDQAKDELDEESAWEDTDDYGTTIVAGSDSGESLYKAGSNDEIEIPEEEESSEPADPTRDYPLPFTTVDESYFTDALFIGDSRLQGFGFWSGLPATYYCATGFQLYKYDTAKVVQTENGKVPIFEALPYDAFTKIYIKVGLNELGFGTEENFEKYYAQLIAQLREYEPRAVIYVHAILPVTAEKSASDKAHNNPNIVERNESLKKFAEEQKAYFLDAGPVLSTEDGSLRPEMTTDGIHLSAQYMKIWRDYLCEHAVNVTNPVENPADKPTEEPAQESAEEPTEEPAEEPVNDPE